MDDYIEETYRVLRANQPVPDAIFRFRFDPQRRTTEQRLIDMANRIRGFVRRQRTNIFYVTLVSETGQLRSEPFRGADAFTDDILQNFLASILHSDETVVLESIRIEVTLIGAMLSDSRQEGRGRTVGMKCIPPSLKQMGLICHKDTDKYSQELHEEGLCGMRAVLFCRNTDHYRNQPLEVLRRDSRQLGASLGLSDGTQTHQDFGKLILLPDWKHIRVVIFSQYRRKLHEYVGQDWTNEYEDSTQIDPKTIHVLFDNQDQHYWSVGDIKALLTRKERPNSVACYMCFNVYRDHDTYSNHSCHKLECCKICCASFTSENYLLHLYLKRNDLECTVCEKNVFNGTACFERHKKTKCKPPRRPKPKCPDCGKALKINHVCYAGKCKFCEQVFTLEKEYQAHHCFWKRSTDYYDNFKRNQQGEIKTWNNHWFYDFETCRVATDRENIYKHEVMAWAVQLIIPDKETADYIEEKQYLKFVEDLISEHCASLDFVQTYRIPHVHNETILVYGRAISTFMLFLELVSKDKRVPSSPKLWAHNASKFDVKFIMNWYYQERGYQLSGYVELGDEFDKRKYSAYRQNQHQTVKTLGMLSVGTKVLQLIADHITFQCSMAHFSCELRKVPKMFGLEEEVKKGEFPYGRLNHGAWGSKHFNGLPPLEEYDPNSKPFSRRQEIIAWWVKEQQHRNVSRSSIAAHLSAFEEVDEIVNNLQTYQAVPGQDTIPWDFDTEISEYLFADVNVGARCIEQYHAKAVEMHSRIPESMVAGKQLVVSPLDSSTAAGWAMQVYKTWFVPEETLCHLTVKQAKIIRQSLRGGRTDKRANIVQVTPERYAAGDRIVYVDFKSLYPSVQKSEVHGTHFPVGVGSYLPWGYQMPPPENPQELYRGQTNNTRMLRLMQDKTGFLHIYCERRKYSTHPTFATNPDENSKVQKMMFENEDSHGWYAWPEIEEAIRSGEVEVFSVNDAILFERGTNVFSSYVDFFFAIKQESEETGNAGFIYITQVCEN